MGGNTVGQRLTRWFRALPRRVREYGPEVIGWAAVIGVFVWEARNSTLGFEQMWRPGLLWAAIGGICTSLAAIFIVRLMMERFRAMGTEEKGAEGNFALAMLYGLLAAGAALVVLFGVWSNLAADSVRRGNHEIESAGERSEIIKGIRSLQGDLRALPETIDIGLEADRESLRKVENIGRQWELPKLDNNPGGDCDADLKPYPRSLCNQAADLRSDIDTAEKAIVKRAEIQAKLETEQAKLVDQVDSEGVEHLQEMAALFGDESQWKMVGSIATLICSAILLIIAAFLTDVMLERRQHRAGA
jgi:hypothetical protein